MKSNIVILSGACCNPALRGMDVQIENVLRASAHEKGVDTTIRTVSISNVAMGGFDGFGSQLANDIKTLFKQKGMGVLPIVVIDGKIQYYATVPTFENACALFAQISPQ